jgi:hypothetical protein
MGSVKTFAGIAALVAGLATHAAAQQQCGPCGSDWVSYEMKDKLSLNTTLTVTSPFTSGSIFLTKTHRLLVPAGLNGAGPASPEPHYLGVELLPGTYDTTTTPPLTFTTALGSVTFKPGQLKFFYDPSSKASRRRSRRRRSRPRRSSASRRARARRVRRRSSPPSTGSARSSPRSRASTTRAST